jgi:hypothetical protein
MIDNAKVILFPQMAKVFSSISEKRCIFANEKPYFSMTRTQIINKNRHLFWYTPEEKKQDISDALLVERILNDGSLEDYRDLISALGGKRVAEVFFSAKGRQKENYYPEIYHFFSLLLSKYAQGNT